MFELHSVLNSGLALSPNIRNWTKDSMLHDMRHVDAKNSHLQILLLYVLEELCPDNLQYLFDKDEICNLTYARSFELLTPALCP